MKIDILTYSRPERFYSGHGWYLGGGTSYVCHWANMMKRLGNEITFTIEGEEPNSKADILFLSTFGCDKERNDTGRDNSDRKFAQLQKLDIPKFVLIHGQDEFRLYKHSVHHLQELKDIHVIITGDSKPILDAVKQYLPNCPLTIIPIPYHFKKEFFTTKKKPRTIVSPARIAAQKGTHKILDIAQNIPKWQFNIRGAQKGMYWFYGLSKHPYINGSNVKFVGPTTDNMEDYRSASFSIDLTTFWRNGELEGRRTQYTTLEAINSGCIPITWDCWKMKKGGWDGLFLPSPIKRGARIEWDARRCSEMINKMKYDPEIAEANFKKLKKTQSYEAIGPQFMELFK